ncbi:MAG: hypothetical protein WCV58_01155 [Patescibacteria group bacterium]|jgi:hypothetical protein
MENDLDRIEEDLKKKEKYKKEQKKSGRSVFRLQEIIKNKHEGSQKEESGDGSKALAGDS